MFHASGRHGEMCLEDEHCRSSMKCDRTKHVCLCEEPNEYPDVMGLVCKKGEDLSKAFDSVNNSRELKPLETWDRLHKSYNSSSLCGQNCQSIPFVQDIGNIVTINY